MTPIISVRNLGKRYQIGTREPYYNLRESLARTAAAPFRHAARLFSARRNGVATRAAHVWALREVSFEVMPGEVLGIIGCNGAGKSTLLKILSRITEPSEGEVDLCGRVASLLEVGTGFHPELTGRENIFLNGAILGMRRAEIASKFDEIVDFSGIEKFIDTPVKRYSSGMYVRLAFAVAAHLQPEILLVDEVLAVGDAEFQKKCLGKMSDVARGGRTVLFVSHNMAAVEALCQSCMLIKDGRLAAVGEPGEVVARHLASGLRPGTAVRSLIRHPGRRPGSSATMTAVELWADGRLADHGIRMGTPLSIVLSYCASDAFRPVFGVSVKTIQGQPVFTASDRFAQQLRACAPVTQGQIACRIERLMLMPGTYMIDLWLGDPGADFDVIHDAISLEVMPADMFGNGSLPSPAYGPIFCPATFTLMAETSAQERPMPGA
jgi:lipopolysaccharide transport system ATP-binding protein